jgi:DnaJ domain
MGTLYDLLGALPSDDAEGLRAAFRKAAKATHPDINPDDPESSLRFRELVRAYDILKDVEQRETYDELLAIALQPPASKSTRIYERVRKFATNTMAATIISGILVGGYTLFGHFSKSPGAAELLTDKPANGAEQIAAEEPSAQAAATVQRDLGIERDEAPAEIIAAAEIESEAGEGDAKIIAGIDAKPDFAGSDLLIRHDPRVVQVYADHGIVLYRMREFDHTLARMTPPPLPKRHPNRRRFSAAGPHKHPSARHKAARAKQVQITAAIEP